MPVAEVLAGIALVKSSVDFIKSNIETAKDIGEIGSHIDALFRGKDEAQAAANKKSGVGVMDQFNVKNIAQETIDAKVAAEKLQEVASLIDMRFGPGTWAGIVAERAKRIQEAKEAEKQARIAAKKKRDALMSDLKTGALVVGVIAVGAGLIVAAMLYVQDRIMAKLFRTVSAHEPVKHGTSIGRKPIFSTMNKNKRRSFKKYRGQGR